MANKKPNWAAWALRFVGSLAYLVVVWQLWQGIGAGTPGGTALYTSNVFAPVLFGLAVISAVSLFLGTLASLAGSGKDMSAWNWRLSAMGGFSLLSIVSLIPGSSSWAWIALVGFVLAFIGIGMDMM